MRVVLSGKDRPTEYLDNVRRVDINYGEKMIRFTGGLVHINIDKVSFFGIQFHKICK